MTSNYVYCLCRCRLDHDWCGRLERQGSYFLLHSFDQLWIKLFLHLLWSADIQKKVRYSRQDHNGEIGRSSLRDSRAIVTPLVATIPTRVRFGEGVGTLATRPSHSLPWLPPDTLRPVSPRRLVVVVRRFVRHVARIPIRPFLHLGRLPWTFGAACVLAILADRHRRRDEQRFALVAAATDPLSGMLIHQLASRLRLDRQHRLPSLLLPLLRWLRALALCFLYQSILLGRVAGALGATLVLTLRTDAVGSKGCAASMAAAVHAHANWLFHTLDVGIARVGRDPFVCFQGQAILCEEGAGTLLLNGAASVGSGNRRGSSRRRDSDGFFLGDRAVDVSPVPKFLF